MTIIRLYTNPMDCAIRSITHGVLSTKVAKHGTFQRHSFVEQDSIPSSRAPSGSFLPIRGLFLASSNLESPRHNKSDDMGTRALDHREP